MFRRLERGIERLLVGRPQPTPKAIRDLGKTVNQARPVQLVIESLNMPTIERTDISQLGSTVTQSLTPQPEVYQRFIDMTVKDTDVDELFIPDSWDS